METDDEAIFDRLRRVSAATVISQLQRRGIWTSFLHGLTATRPGTKLVGRARTLRYVPLREDLRGELSGTDNAQRMAVESMRPGQVLVIEARGVADAGTIGDIYVARCKALGAHGVVTDGALRDSPGVRDIDLPVYHHGVHAATLGRRHLPLVADVPVACAGVLVMPGDVMFGDAEGVQVIPAALADEVSRAAVVQEDEEAFAAERVAAGESIVGLFPLSDDRRADYEAWQAARGRSGNRGGG